MAKFAVPEEAVSGDVPLVWSIIMSRNGVLCTGLSWFDCKEGKAMHGLCFSPPEACIRAGCHF